MWLSLLSILVLMLVRSQADTSTALVGNQLNFNFCAINRTIELQLSTIDNESSFSCQCHVGPPQAFRKEEYEYTSGIGAYKLHTLAKNWNDARRICNEEGGHLAIINSRAEEAVSNL